MNKAYPSNLTNAQFELLSDIIPEPKPGGRPREVDMWSVLNAIFYLLCEGCQWRSLPGDFPAWQTVYTYFRKWRQDGTWIEIHDSLRDWTRIEQDRHKCPSEAIIDSQSVKSAAMLCEAVGYDAGKNIKGRKRFNTVDTLGLVLRVLVTAANVIEREGGIQVLQRVHQTGKTVWRLHTIWAARFGGKLPPKSCLVDGGFNGDNFLKLVMDVCHWLVQVVLRPKEHQGFVLLPKRWVVERTFGWLMNCRRLTA